MPKESSGTTPVRTVKDGRQNRLAPDEFYINEQGCMVFTEQYHLRRGYCCKSQCRHCPYGEKKS